MSTTSGPSSSRYGRWRAAVFRALADVARDRVSRVAVYHHLESCSLVQTGKKTEICVDGMLCVPMKCSQFERYSRYFLGRRGRPGTRLRVSGRWETGKPAGFDVPLDAAEPPSDRTSGDVVHHAEDPTVAPSESDPVAFCLHRLDWSRPYRFELQRYGRTRICFVSPENVSSPHWSELAEFDDKPFEHLVNEVMEAEGWPRNEKIFCM